MRPAEVMAGIAAVAVLMTACSTAEPDGSRSPEESGTTATTALQPSEARAEQGLQWRMRWRDDGAIDLHSPSGTFVRAVVEADLLALFDWDVEGEFPGVSDALSSWWRGNTFASNEPYNTADQILKIADFRDVDERSSVALVCTRGKAASSEESFPPYLSSENPPNNDAPVNVERVAFDRIGSSPPDVRPGDRLFPGHNVFGDWRVTEYKAAWAPNVPGEPTPDVSICGDMGDLAAPGPSYPGWSGTGV